MTNDLNSNQFAVELDEEIIDAEVVLAEVDPDEVVFDDEDGDYDDDDEEYDDDDEVEYED
jgi:hypothetical protein